MTSCPFYPMRPTNGGRFDLSDTYSNNTNWLFEPKINGWRAVIHPSSGTCFNRHGERLSIEDNIKPLLTGLQNLKQEWLDCEVLERRGTGKQILIVLDTPNSTEQFKDRVVALKDLEPFSLVSANQRGVYRLPQLNFEEAQNFWNQNDVPSISGVLFEGLVAKRKDSLYIKNSRPTTETTKWIKHRFA